MKRTYEDKVITVIFKNGETGTFEHCLNVYETEGYVEIIEDYTRELEEMAERGENFTLPPDKAKLFAEALRHTEL